MESASSQQIQREVLGRCQSVILFTTTNPQGIQRLQSQTYSAFTILNRKLTYRVGEWNTIANTIFIYRNRDVQAIGRYTIIRL